MEIRPFSGVLFTFSFDGYSTETWRTIFNFGSCYLWGKQWACLSCVCVCVKIDLTLPYIANPVKHEQALNKLKDCFSVYSLKDYCGSGCLVYFYFLSLWKVLMTLLQIIVLLSIFLLPLYFGSKRENACTWFCLVIWVSLIYRYFIGEGYQTLFGSNMIIYNMYGFRNHWHSLKEQLLYSLKLKVEVVLLQRMENCQM